MEQRSLLVSAIGVGLGVGIGLASGQVVGKWAAPASWSCGGVTPEAVEQELRRQVVDARESEVTFDEFPYYLSEKTRAILTSAAYIHLKQPDILKYTQNLSPASQTILLSGPSELYQQMLTKALAHYYKAKLLLLDVTDFSIKIRSKYGISSKDVFVKRSISETTLDRVSGFFGSLSTILHKEDCRGLLHRQRSNVELKPRKQGFANGTPQHDKTSPVSADKGGCRSECASINQVPLKCSSSWSFDEKVLINSLYKVLISISGSYPFVLYIRDVENFINRSETTYFLFQKMLTRLSGQVIILGSRLSESDNDCKDLDARLASLFHYNIEIRPPEDETHLVSWKAQLEKDTKRVQIQDNINHITEVLAANDLECEDLGSICLSDMKALSTYMEEIVLSAVSYHLMNNKDPQYRNGKLVISSKSLSRGLSIFQDNRFYDKDTLKLEAEEDLNENDTTVKKTEQNVETLLPENISEPEKSTTLLKDGETSSLPAKLPEVVPDNEFEKRIILEVIPANEIGVTFDDIGALDETKESLQELIMLPLKRPDLFKGGLLKPCRGILLFGPPGTGKTMLAKAIANEAGASFINVSMSTITSKWFGEDEKNVKALFTVAAKVAPTIIFVDEVDGMLGQRTRVGEHEAMRKIKNEFMTRWDGLLTKSGERILVLAATNRPFDLDEAIIRRFERRIMVGLPSAESRELILRKVLSKEKVERLDYKELATITDGYSGSDLKNLCVAAAYRPVKELLQRERSKKLDRDQKTEEGDSSSLGSTSGEDDVPLRPLNMDDLKQAKNQVAASFAPEGSVMNELKQWNDLYGDGGSRKKQQLTYFF
ncbi:ribosome biogenesis ATPase RIX7-like isoform X1 [Canna indica]|uniref:Ribosome biogenesis ATPase RIX7-like isoform X1 n=1 Tax=Canna indica TaxID=4628 RepID=A0AAQ3KTY5_9LILI|nr:ribosome biogenesis ATPase RIX7-like isoform X1 [Canna indica]